MNKKIIRPWVKLVFGVFGISFAVDACTFMLGTSSVAGPWSAVFTASVITGGACVVIVFVANVLGLTTWQSDPSY